MDLLDRIGLQHPVVQAGMGGGVVGAELAGAVSAAGALGTVGTMPPTRFAAELTKARHRADGRPVAANLLVPFARPAHLAACVDARASLVVFHGGLGRRRSFEQLRAAGIPLFCTVGEVEQARAALAAGADGLVVQGVEAGGHLMGAEPLHTLLPRVRELGRFPILAAGGIAEFRDVATVLSAGADAAVAGTRFLMTHESRAHPAYKQRVQDATRTVRTMLFGVGWRLAHGVVRNAATDRWSDEAGDLPAWLHGVERASAPLVRILPLRASNAMTSRQRVGLPFFGPALPLADVPEAWVDRTALYAGETVRRIDDIVSAREAVERLTSDG